MRTERLLSRPEDLHCIVFHTACLVAYGLAFWIWHHRQAAGIDGPLGLAAFVAGAAFLLGWISGIDVGVNFHNHTHRPIFRQAWLNRWAGRLWTFSGGWPALFWRHAHVTVHHRNLLGELDWTLPRRRADGRFENIYRYLLLHWPWRYAVCFWKDIGTGRLDRRQAAVEFAWFLALWSIPFLIDPWMALCLWVLPHWIGNCVTMGSGMYVQHAGCVAKTAADPVRHSNGYLSRFFNLTMFNIGYHIEHHDHAGVHWADLPEFHRRVRERLLERGAHYVRYGYYGAARRLARVGG
ncbi:MAG: fatty acid desaturase, partial [Planctomycetes bacterium]|nr:fatty acid desaturase [Planctomycetota bacterium]